MTNDAYAQEVIKLCREQGQDELTGYANRLDQLTFGKSSAPAASLAVTESLKAKPALAEDEDTEDEFDKSGR